MLNLGLVESFPPSFLRFLLKVRRVVRACRGRLVLCGLRPEHHPILELPAQVQPFHITRTEGEAIRRATF